MAKVEQCATLQELTSHFHDKITATEHCINLQGTGKDASKSKVFNGLCSTITELQAGVSSLRNEISKRRKSLGHVQEMRSIVACLQERINSAQANLPHRLPSVTHNFNGNKENTRRDEEVIINGSSKQLPSTKCQQRKANGKVINIPSICYLTVQEFDSVPKYIKGRLTYERMNTVVEDINTSLHGKYTLLSTKRSAQTDYIRGKIISYKEEETKETKGTRFFTEGDIKEFGSHKVDGTFRTVMTILRHCKRIKEARGGGLTRYIVCD